MERGKSRFQAFLQLDSTQLFPCPPSKMERTCGWLGFICGSDVICGSIEICGSVVVCGSVVISGLCLAVQPMDPMGGECAHSSHIPALLEFLWLGHRGALRAPAPCLGTLQLWGVVFSFIEYIS